MTIKTNTAKVTKPVTKSTKKPSVKTAKKPVSKPKEAKKEPIQATTKDDKKSKPVADSVVKPWETLPLEEKCEYLDRVSAYALYTNATIYKRNNNATYLRALFMVKSGSKKQECIEAEVALYSSILKPVVKAASLEEKGKAIFRVMCDNFRVFNEYKSVVITTVYGDKYSYKNGETQLFTAKTKKWEKV